MKNRDFGLFWAYSVAKFLILIFLLMGPLKGAEVGTKVTPKVPWILLTYMAANNNLYEFGQRNILEMTTVGSNKNISIFTQIDHFGRNEVNRYKVEPGRTQLLATASNGQEGISGTPESLFGFAKYIIERYPAEHIAIVVWNHGSGILEPLVWKSSLGKYFNRDGYFTYNEKTRQFEIDKNVFPEEEVFRGIAFNDLAKKYLTTAQLKTVVDRISKELLGGKKIDILAFDACHMAMVEIGSAVKDSVSYMVGSEELEPGSGWHYDRVLAPFTQRALSPEEFAKRMVDAYGEAYNNNFADLTMSAIKLETLSEIEKNLDTTATLLLSLSKEQNKNEILNILLEIRKSASYTTAFLEPSYIDLMHFYKSLALLVDKKSSSPIKAQVVQNINEGITLMQKSIVKNYAGAHAKNAFGLSIYFPVRALHPSYIGNNFSKSNNWCNLLYAYLQKRAQGELNEEGN